MTRRRIKARLDLEREGSANFVRSQNSNFSLIYLKEKELCLLKKTFAFFVPCLVFLKSFFFFTPYFCSDSCAFPNNSPFPISALRMGSIDMVNSYHQCLLLTFFIFIFKVSVAISTIHNSQFWR